MTPRYRCLIASVLGSILLSHVPAGYAATLKVIHDFSNGHVLSSGLLAVNGKFYGTARGRAHRDGFVYSLDPGTGRIKVVYSFRRGADGIWPAGDLIGVKRTLYGTTVEGGGEGTCINGCGTVFSIDPKTGAETVLYRFCSYKECRDGDTPDAGVIDIDGTLYGTTTGGGTSGGGTVFSVDPATGAEAVVYSFCSTKECKDGDVPDAGVIDVNGALYGTTIYGGEYNNGTVFSVNAATGAETVLYSFAGKDGSGPEAGVIDVDGTLYGTTEFGGTRDWGTVFALDPDTGAETVRYSFAGPPDAGYPRASLINVKGTLFGTTYYGGTGHFVNGAGTVFSLEPNNGTERVLHSFCTGRTCWDGNYPDAGLIEVKGALYGTTSGGTVYSMKP